MDGGVTNPNELSTAFSVVVADGPGNAEKFEVRSAARARASECPTGHGSAARQETPLR